MLPTGAAGKDLLVGVNRPVDPANLSDLERKHLPVIDAPERVGKGRPFDVTIEVGRLLAHPNEVGHFIQSIELWADETFLAKVHLAPAGGRPKVTLRVSLHHAAAQLHARSSCNLHGVWVGQKAISLEQ